MILLQVARARQRIETVAARTSGQNTPNAKAKAVPKSKAQAKAKAASRPPGAVSPLAAVYALETFQTIPFMLLPRQTFRNLHQYFTSLCLGTGDNDSYFPNNEGLQWQYGRFFDAQAWGRASEGNRQHQIRRRRGGAGA